MKKIIFILAMIASLSSFSQSVSEKMYRDSLEDNYRYHKNQAIGSFFIGGFTAATSTYSWLIGDIKTWSTQASVGSMGILTLGFNINGIAEIREARKVKRLIEEYGE